MSAITTEHIERIQQHIHILDLSKLISEYSVDDRLDAYERGKWICVGDLLIIAAEIGRIDAFRARCSRRGELKQEIKQQLIRTAAVHGQINVLIELRAERHRVGWGLTGEDARSRNNYALRFAAMKGHVAVLVELRVGWGLTAQDARAHNNSALQLAAAKGQVGILIELRTNWGLTREDARSESNSALRWAAMHGHTNILIELRTNWGLIEKDTRSCKNEAFRMATKNDHVPVLIELRNNWGLKM